MKDADREYGCLADNQLERVAALFKSFAEPTRLAILQELKAGPRKVGEMVAAIGTSQANISKQLHVLSQAGVIHREKRGTCVLCSIPDPAVLELCRLVCDKLNRDLALEREPLHF
ncbi:MAG: helix-turn-helix transcriptional regulator [Verrucomicrobiae bacterium]|nr:helix-turn-helix transcriptional regulator [Verrucomicrobiae bacterium]